MVMSWVMLSRTCTRISVGDRFFSVAISVVISSIVFSPLLFSQRLAMSSLPKYRELASLISTIFPSGFFAMCPLCLDLVHQVGVRGAANCGQGHADFDAVIIDCDSVDETEVYDVYRYLGIIAVAECVHNSVHCERFGHEG